MSVLSCSLAVSISSLDVRLGCTVRTDISSVSERQWGRRGTGTSVSLAATAATHLQAKDQGRPHACKCPRASGSIRCAPAGGAPPPPQPLRACRQRSDGAAAAAPVARLPSAAAAATPPSATALPPAAAAASHSTAALPPAAGPPPRSPPGCRRSPARRHRLPTRAPLPPPAPPTADQLPPHPRAPLPPIRLAAMAASSPPASASPSESPGRWSAEARRQAAAAARAAAARRPARVHNLGTQFHNFTFHFTTCERGNSNYHVRIRFYFRVACLRYVHWPVPRTISEWISCQFRD